MAKRLSENLTSLYLGAAQRLKPKTARRKIVVYVESYDDVFFWRTVLMISRMTAVILKSCCLPAVRWAKGKKLC